MSALSSGDCGFQGRQKLDHLLVLAQPEIAIGQQEDGLLVRRLRVRHEPLQLGGLRDIGRLVIGQREIQANRQIVRLRFQCLLVLDDGFFVKSGARQGRAQVRPRHHVSGDLLQVGAIFGESRR